MRIFRPCFIAGWLYPDAIFRIRTDEKIACLTFDDGPDPDSTPLILDILRKHNLKAAFFCCGSAAEKYPELVRRIVSEGHLTGNHTYSHLSGWKTPVNSYVEDVERAAALTSAEWFRPPYGRLRLRQYCSLKKQYKIVFWDIMPYDFDKSFSEEASLKTMMKKLRPGSVIVLHDSPGSVSESFLNKLIISAFESGYRFVLPF
jgi:peptidoglycan/xylan/chitin deacetylase (PgdA/CDA1 family)